MITDFLKRRTTVDAFERNFLDAFKSQADNMDEMATRALGELFTSVDAYSPDWLPGDDDQSSISEDQLRQDARCALQALNRIKGRRTSDSHN